MGRGKESIIGKAKATHKSKAKHRIKSPLPMGREVVGDLQQSRIPSCLMVIWEDKHHQMVIGKTNNIQMFLLLLLPLNFYTAHDVTWSGISVWPV